MERDLDPAGAFLFVSLFGGVFLFVLLEGRRSRVVVRDQARREALARGRFIKEYGCVKVQQARGLSIELSFSIYEYGKDGTRFVALDWVHHDVIASRRKLIRLPREDAQRLLALLDEAAMVGVVK